ncbi:hypothetical protein REPUB_Repub16aG0114100 [Reevesia pubescens]
MKSFLRSPSLAIVPKCPKKMSIVTVWLATSKGVMKFNFDGSALEIPGPAGIGGVGSFFDLFCFQMVFFSQSSCGKR